MNAVCGVCICVHVCVCEVGLVVGVIREHRGPFGTQHIQQIHNLSNYSLLE